MIGSGGNESGNAGDLGRAGDGVEEARVGCVVVEKVDVDGEGERGRVIAEPGLDLFCVRTVAEEQAPAGVAKGVPARPGHAGRSSATVMPGESGIERRP